MINPWYNKIIRNLNQDTIMEINMTFTKLGEQGVFSQSGWFGSKPSQVYINGVLQDSNNGIYNI